MFFSNFINHFFWRGTYRNAIKHIMQKGEIISDPFWQYGWPKKWHFASLIQGVSVCEGSFAWEAVLKKLLLGGPPSAIYVAVPPLSLMVFFDRYILWCILRVILLQPTAEVDECVVECRRWWAVRGICPTWANSPHCGRTSNTFPFIFLPCILLLSLSHLQMYLSPFLSLRKLLTLRAHYLLLGKNISNHVYWTFESSL